MLHGVNFAFYSLQTDVYLTSFIYAADLMQATKQTNKQTAEHLTYKMQMQSEAAEVYTR